MRLGINIHVIGKLKSVDEAKSEHERMARKKAVSAWSRKWTESDLSPEELLEGIRMGWGFGAVYRNGRRQNDNVICTEVLAVDIDNKNSDQRIWGIDDLLQHAFVADYGSFIYTTQSHTPEAPRYRVVFELDGSLAPEKIKPSFVALAGLFDSDRAAVARSQAFYGSPGCESWMVGKKLPLTVLAALVSDSENRSAAASTAQRGSTRAGLRSEHRLPPDVLIKVANGGAMQPLKRIRASESVHCPVHVDSRASAFVVKNKRGVMGVHCRAASCMTTYWMGSISDMLDEVDPVGEFWASEILRRVESLDGTPDGDSVCDTIYFDDLSFDLRRPEERYLPEIPSRRGLVLVKSPKGSGKTTALAKLVDKIDGRVLMIGHRVLLIQSLAQKLGLECYRDSRTSPSDRYAVSVDSLARRMNEMGKYTAYATVIIDEVEQVVAHLLSDTLKENRLATIRALLWMISHAERIVLLDADLGPNTCILLKVALGPERFKEVMDHAIVIRNAPNLLHPDARFGSPTLHLFEKQIDLEAELMRRFCEGVRPFVCCNSKAEAIRIHRMLENDLRSRGHDGRLLLVTSDTTDTSEVAQFMEDPSAHFWSYVGIVSSPSLGTGVDINLQYPSDGTEIVDVFGIFQNGINKHWDIDQHLSRVRNPRSVSAWISSRKLAIESDPAVVEREILEQDTTWSFTTAINDEGFTIAKGDPALDLIVSIESGRRRSMRRLRDWFVRARKQAGCLIEIHPASDSEGENGAIQLAKKTATAGLRDDKALKLLRARQLTELEAEKLQDGRRAGRTLSTVESECLDRYYLENFYRAEISPALVDLDEGKKLRRSIKRYEWARKSDENLLKDDLEDEARSGDSDYGRFPSDREARLQTARLIKRLLESLGLGALLRGEFPDNWRVSAASRQVARFQNCMDDVEDQDLKHLLGFSKRADLETKPILSINELLKSIGLRTSAAKFVRTGGTKEGFYSLDRERFDFIDAVMARRDRENLRLVRNVSAPGELSESAETRAANDTSIDTGKDVA